jgi:type I restriction enzyme S subunit
MIEGLQPYAEYKDSGQQWLGQVPAHWDLKPGHAAFVPRGVKNTGMKEKTVLSLSYGRIKVKPTDRQHGLVPDSYETYQIVDEGNIIIRGTDMQNDHTSLRIGLSRNRGVISSAYLCFETRKTVTPDYGYQILNTFDLTKAIYRYGSGLRQNLDDGEIRRLPIFIPPLDEQAAIVRFLDHANRKIDGFIRAKRKLIGLLNEQKQAIIHRAVTRGLNPNVPLKSSGIPWLGDIPKHWHIRRLRTIVHRIDQGVSPQATGFLAEGDSWGVLKSGCVNHGVFRQTEHKQLAKGFKADPAIAVKVGDVLISRACGSPKLVGSAGKVHSLDYKLILSDKTFRAVFRSLVNSDFMVYAMNCSYYRQQVEQAISGAEGMANNLPLSELRSFVFAIPPSDEAEAIALSLEKELEQFNTAITRTEREIALMQEYRTRLTADVVTGKLDVRAAAAELPELVEDDSVPEPSDVAEDFEEAEA